MTIQQNKLFFLAIYVGHLFNAILLCKNKNKNFTKLIWNINIGIMEKETDNVKKLNFRYDKVLLLLCKNACQL